MSLPPGVDPATVPLGPPPPGVVPDFSDKGWGTGITDLLVVLLVFNTIFTVARVYTRAVVLKAFGVDDAFCILAWACVVVHMSWTLDAVHNGFGRHIWNIPLINAKPLYRAFFTLEAFSTAVYLSLKLTFLLTYLRIFSPTKAYKYCIWGGIVACTLFYVGTFFWELFKCQPMAASWDPFVKGKCANEFEPGAETGIFNVISDVYILILPMPMIWKLHTNTKRKLQLSAIFAIGTFTVITSIVRLAETINQDHNPDSTWALGRVDIWALLEYSVGLMVACTLVFSALWNQVLSKPFHKIGSKISSATKSVLSITHSSKARSESGSQRELSLHHKSSVETKDPYWHYYEDVPPRMGSTDPRSSFGTKDESQKSAEIQRPDAAYMA